MRTTSGHEAGAEAQAFSEDHTSGSEVMLEAFQPQENGEALAPVGMDSFHSSENDMFGLGGDDGGDKDGIFDKIAGFVDAVEEIFDTVWEVGEYILGKTFKGAVVTALAAAPLFALDYYGISTILGYTLPSIITASLMTAAVFILKWLAIIGAVGGAIFVAGMVLTKVWEAVTFKH